MLRHPRVVIFTVFALAALLVLLALGRWQLHRLKWKTGLLAAIETRMATVPRSLGGVEEALSAYTRVQLRGCFLHDLEAHVYTALSEPRGRFGGQGYWVLTPLRLNASDCADGMRAPRHEGAREAIVYVNRGFVPLERKASHTRAESITVSAQTIEGIVRSAHRADWASPEADIAGNVWYTRDPAAFARAHGLNRVGIRVAPFYVDAMAGPSGALPQGGETRLVFANNHLAYALTWFGLAAALVLVYGVWLYGAIRQARGAVR